MKNKDFYAEIEQLAKEKNLPKEQLMCPVCREILDARNSSMLQFCSCKSLGIDSNGTGKIDRVIYGRKERFSS